MTSQGQEKMFILYNLNLKQKLRSWFSLDTVIETSTTSTTHTNLFLSWRHEIITPSTLISREFNTTHGTFHQCVWRREGLMRSLKPICPPYRTRRISSVGSWGIMGLWVDSCSVPHGFLKLSDAPSTCLQHTYAHTLTHTHTYSSVVCVCWSCIYISR